MNTYLFVLLYSDKQGKGPDQIFSVLRISKSKQSNKMGRNVMWKTTQNHMSRIGFRRGCQLVQSYLQFIVG